MRHSLIYNYLREPGVLMLQNANKHPYSKHLITSSKGTIFYWNSHKKTIKKFGKAPIFNKRLGRFGNNSYLCTARTRQASQRCSNVRVVFHYPRVSRLTNNSQRRELFTNLNSLSRYFSVYCDGTSEYRSYLL